MVVVPELMPPMLEVGEVLPIGGVVPGVVLGVVPGVVLGVVPVVVFGVVPVVVLGVAVLGIVVLPVVGGQIEVEVLAAEPGKVEVEFGVEVELLVDGEVARVEVDEVVVDGQFVDREVEGSVDALGVAEGVVVGEVVLCGVTLDGLFDCPGTTGVGAIAPVDACAAAMLAAKHTTHVKISAVLLMRDFSYVDRMAVALVVDAHIRELPAPG